MKVQQELMRHASIQTTMNVYGAAMAESKREANSKVVRRWFCLGSQFAPIMTPRELKLLLRSLFDKGWLDID